MCTLMFILTPPMGLHRARDLRWALCSTTRQILTQRTRLRTGTVPAAYQQCVLGQRTRAPLKHCAHLIGCKMGATLKAGKSSKIKEHKSTPERWLSSYRVLGAAFPKDLGSIPSTHTAAHNRNSRTKGFNQHMQAKYGCTLKQN